MKILENAVTLPSGACDCHAHVFGPFDLFPLAPTLTYCPPVATADDYIALLQRLGFERAVLVQGSAHGLDNSAMLAALRDHAQGSQGIAMRGVGVSESSITDAELARWRQLGVRGLRFRHAPTTGTTPHYHNTVGLEHFFALAPRMRELDMHAQIWTHASCWEDIEESVLGTKVPIVIDHMGRVEPQGDIGTTSYERFLQCLARGDIWVKMTAYRNTSCYPGMEDLDDVMASFLRCNPDRLLWGSDWPHINCPYRVDTGALLQHFLRHVGDPNLARRILVENPARLYGF